MKHKPVNFRLKSYIALPLLWTDLMAGFLTVAKGVSLEKSSPEFPVKDEYRNSPVKVLSQTSCGIFANYLVLKSTEKQHRDCEGVVYLPSTLL